MADGDGGEGEGGGGEGGGEGGRGWPLQLPCRNTGHAWLGC